MVQLPSSFLRVLRTRSGSKCCWLVQLTWKIVLCCLNVLTLLCTSIVLLLGSSSSIRGKMVGALCLVVAPTKHQWSWTLWLVVHSNVVIIRGNVLNVFSAKNLGT